ncbi:MAG TPA: hypothetical protein VHC69_08705 [Polyangiaceae bacterium]|nr:hypothetical protein [Polyangiaceae bacterium]
MRGLIFNLLADLARDAGCEEDAWTVALAASQEMAEELAREADEDELIPGLLEEVSIQGGADFTFRWLLRTAPSFQDDDDTDVLEARLTSPEVSDAMLRFETAWRRGTNRD